MQHCKNPYLVHFGTFAPDGPGKPGGNEFTPLGPLDKNDIVLLPRNELKERRRRFGLKMKPTVNITRAMPAPTKAQKNRK